MIILSSKPAHIRQTYRCFHPCLAEYDSLRIALPNHSGKFGEFDSYHVYGAWRFGGVRDGTGGGGVGTFSNILVHNVLTKFVCLAFQISRIVRMIY